MLGNALFGLLSGGRLADKALFAMEAYPAFANGLG
jgi:hypothetical protein